MTGFHEFPDEAALVLRHGLLDFQGFQDVLIPVLNDFGNCLRQCLGGAEIDQGGRRSRLPADILLGKRLDGGLGRYRLACRHFRLRRRFSGGGFLFLIVKEQENQGQAAYDQEADDDAFFIESGCMKKGQAFSASSNLA